MITDYFSDWLTQTALIEHEASTVDDYMGSRPTWALLRSLPCLVRPLRAESRPMQGRDAAKTWARIYFGTDPEVTTEHRVTVDGRHYSPEPSIDVQSEGGLFYVDAIQSQ